jgi:hypothetical protein
MATQKEKNFYQKVIDVLSSEIHFTVWDVKQEEWTTLIYAKIRRSDRKRIKKIKQTYLNNRKLGYQNPINELQYRMNLWLQINIKIVTSEKEFNEF